MREFFKGWRRKAGCALLMMAIASCSEWVRSFDAVDGVLFCIGEAQYEAFSATGNIHLLRWRFHHGKSNSYYLATDRVRYGSTVWDCVLPHWCLTVPLTLLAAYLLLAPTPERPLTVRQTDE